MPLTLSGSGGITYPDGTVNTTRAASTAGDTFTGQVVLKNSALDLQSGQIKFPATQSASSNANTLDDYEEGTWTVAYAASGGGMSITTYELRSAYYVKIGSSVTVSFSIATNIVASAGTGNIQIVGLPFPASTGGAQVALSVGYSTNGYILGGYLGDGSSSINLTGFTEVGTGLFTGSTGYGNFIIASMTYKAT